MAALTAIMFTCMIDAFEKRDVATVDIPGAFLQTKMPKEEKDFHVILDGRMAKLLAKITPETYQEYVSQKCGQAYIYCRVNFAIYETLKATLLFRKNHIYQSEDAWIRKQSILLVRCQQMH